MMLDVHERTRTEAIVTARRVVEKQPIFLDIATTGLDQHDEIVEIAVINARGEVMLNTLVKPGNPIPLDAVRIHGIRNQDVADAPRFDVVWRGQLCELLTGSRLMYDQPLCIYNAAYDMRMIRQSLKQYGIEPRGLKPAFCVMTLYAEFYGDCLDARYESYRWQSLTAAAGQCGIVMPPDIHRAMTDARLAMAVLRYMAVQPLEEQ